MSSKSEPNPAVVVVGGVALETAKILRYMQLFCQPIPGQGVAVLESPLHMLQEDLYDILELRRPEPVVEPEKPKKYRPDANLRRNKKNWMK